MTCFNFQSGDDSVSYSERIKTCKEYIQLTNSKLVDRFNHGTSSDELIQARSDFMDELLTQCWKYFLKSNIEKLALVAVGGYGRRELHPYSDIDILVLLDAPIGTQENPDHSSLSQALAHFFKDRKSVV